MMAERRKMGIWERGGGGGGSEGYAVGRWPQGGGSCALFHNVAERDGCGMAPSPHFDSASPLSILTSN